MIRLHRAATSMLDALVRPSASITDAADRRRAAFVSATLATSVPFGVVSTLIRVALDPTYLSAGIVSLFGISVLAILYFVSRTRAHRVAAWLTCIAVVAIAVSVAVRASEGWVFVGYLATAIVLASIVLSPRGTLVIAGIAMLALGGSSLVQPRFADPLFLSTALPFLAIFATMVSLGVVARDGIERDRRAELAASERQFRLAFTTAFDAFAVATNGMVTEATPSFLRLLAPTAELGRPIRDCFPPAARDSLTQALERVQSLELHLGDNCDVTDLEVLITPLGAVDAHRVFVAVRDLTTRRRQERLLAISERAISLGQVTAAVAHEINNPLMFVAANVELLRDPARVALPTAAAPLIADIDAGVDRIKTIVSDLSTLSSSRDNVEMDVDLNEVITLAARMTTRELEAHGHLELDLQALPKLRGNVAKLGQVFVNLIANAARSLPEGRFERNRVTVRTRTSPEGELIATVEDNGSGIPPEVMPRLFTPFFTTRKPGEGTGLGLVISRSIIAAHGGRIEVSSSPEGTTFTIHLPAKTSGEWARPAREQAPPESPATKRLSIVVIDDEPVILRVFRHFLAEHQVFATEDPRAGIEYVRQHAPDLVLCDLTMPAFSGRDVYEVLTREKLISPDHFVIVSGGAVTEEAIDFIRNYPGTVLEKPVNRTTLSSVVAKLTAPR